ncbi:MAG: DUF4395 domain-containing protein [Bacteroidota bacterium]
MKKTIQFGEKVEGFNIPVLNEREIRASAGILFLAALLSLMAILFKGNFLPIKYFITAFLLDFNIRVFINPGMSPSLIIGRIIVRNQRPEYVGAAQKRFAWIIGIGLSALMFIFLVLANAYSPITGLSCLVCLLFLFFESAFGICLGCKFYSLFHKEKAKYCPGEICEVGERQKITFIQFFIVIVFPMLLLFIFSLFNGFFHIQPHDLFS